MNKRTIIPILALSLFIFVLGVRADYNSTNFFLGQSDWCSADSSIVSPTYDALNVVDGIDTGDQNAWISDGNDVSHWVNITFPFSYNVDHIRVKLHDNGDSITNRTLIQYWDNGDWVNVSDDVTPPLGVWENYTIDVNTTVIRIYRASYSDGWSSGGTSPNRFNIAEIEGFETLVVEECETNFVLNSTEDNCYNETNYAINTTYYDFNECDELFIINYTYPDLPYAFSNYFDECLNETNFNRTSVYNDTLLCSYNIFNSTFPILPYSLFNTSISCMNGTTANYTYTYNDSKSCSFNIFNYTLVNCAGNCSNNTCVAPVFPEPVNLYNSFANGGWKRFLDSIIIPLILLIFIFAFFKLNPKKLKGK
jgi:hypothetical protein